MPKARPVADLILRNPAKDMDILKQKTGMQLGFLLKGCVKGVKGRKRRKRTVQT
jgi:hypothetical protein